MWAEFMNDITIPQPKDYFDDKAKQDEPKLLDNSEQPKEVKQAKSV